MNFGGIFSPDSKFSEVMNRLFDLMILNLVFIVMCIPIVTIGANITAMYYVTLRMVRKEDSYTLRSYWKSFKENFRQATVIWLILLVGILFLVIDIFLCTHMLTGSITNICYVFYALLLIAVFTMIYVFPTQARFYNPVKRTFINAMFFSFRHLPSTLVMLALIVAPPLLILQTSDIVFYYYILFCLLFGFSLVAYANSYLLHRIFQKYIPAIEEAQADFAEDEAAEDDPLASDVTVLEDRLR